MSASQRLSDELQGKIRELTVRGLSNRAIARELGIHHGTVAGYKASINPSAQAATGTKRKAERTDEVDKDKWTISLPETQIHTLEELLKYCEVNAELWEVERFVCNKWEMGYKDGDEKGQVLPLFQVKAWLKKRKPVEETQRIIERMYERAAKHAPRYPKITAIKSNSGNIAEISIVDIHHGALIWAKETGWDDWDLNKSTAAHRTAIDDLLSKCDPYKPEKALLILGNDQANADNRAGNTEMGTPQSNDGRYQKVVDASTDCSIDAIDACLMRYGAVDVVMVPGNHDPLTTYHLGKYLAAWYRKTPKVKIINGPNPKRYYQHGINMLMFWHGNNGKVEDYLATMAAEEPEMWGRTKWREAHTADKHHRRLLEKIGGAVRVLPSLRPSCAWSAEHNFVGSVRAAEAYVWNCSEGLVGQLTHAIMREHLKVA